MFRFALWKVKLGLVGRFRGFGDSMEPIIASGSVVTIEPVDVERLEPGDIVAVRVGDETMVHLVKAVDAARRRVEISGTTGPANGWTTFDCVLAICTRIGEVAIPGAREKALRRFPPLARLT